MNFKNMTCAAAGDRVLIEDLRLPARLGVLPSEHECEQTVDLSLEVGLPSLRPFQSDDIHHAINYVAVVDALAHLCVSRHFNLVENLAEEISRMVLDEFDSKWVSVRLRKIDVVPDTRFVGVSIVRRQKLFRWLRLRAGMGSARSGAAHGKGPIEALPVPAKGGTVDDPWVHDAAARAMLLEPFG